jgi:hypothetical protein
VGDGTFNPPISYDTESSCTGIIGVDLDGDRLPDIAATNYTGTNVAVLLNRCVDPSPFLASVTDVPVDEGGLVTVAWRRSGVDVPGERTIIGYRVWRRATLTGAIGVVLEATEPERAFSDAPPPNITYRADGSADVVYWEPLASLPAEQLEGYAYTARTTQDSSRSENPYTAFFVSALTSDPFVFYRSNVDSGYSVDNLPPRAPRHFTGQPLERGIALHWDVDVGADHQAFLIYRGASPDFKPSEESLIAAQADTGYLDRAVTGSPCYKLCAVDLHDNRSEIVTWHPIQTGSVGDQGPLLNVLGVIPNPVRAEAFEVWFALPTSGGTTIEIVDANGRRWVEQSFEGLEAGRHRITIARAERMPPAIYFVRLVQNGKQAEKKLTIVK